MARAGAVLDDAEAGPVVADMHLTLPYPISVNRYWRNFRGRQVVSAEARAYKAEAAAIALVARVQPIGGAVALSLTLHPKRPKKTIPGVSVRCVDVDNALKVAIDALNGIAYTDDSQVVDLHIRRGEPVLGGKLTVLIEAIA